MRKCKASCYVCVTATDKQKPLDRKSAQLLQCDLPEAEELFLERSTNGMRQGWPQDGGHAGEELWGAWDLFEQWVFDKNGGLGGNLEWRKGQVWWYRSVSGAPEWPWEPSAWKFPHRRHPVRGQQGILLSPSGPCCSKQLFQVRFVTNKTNKLILLLRLEL